MSRITFNFKLEKLVHALAYFSKNGVRNLTKLKAAKLLYFADREHLLRHGRPILGDVYFCLPYGPVPSLALNEMSDAIAAYSRESSRSTSPGLQNTRSFSRKPLIPTCFPNRSWKSWRKSPKSMANSRPASWST